MGFRRRAFLLEYCLLDVGYLLGTGYGIRDTGYGVQGTGVGVRRLLVRRGVRFLRVLCWLPLQFEGHGSDVR
ncbi:hypothetical protein B0H11DRAFT_1973137 [Mycena galericulata]|nr:hypothetical protein B0H11DRAFT_1973137 [Mycena galericulata]